MCQKLYCSPLDISQKPVHRIHKILTRVRESLRNPDGANMLKNKLMSLSRRESRRHIDSFPGIESHNCRNDINRQYFEQQLNIRKMCNLYVEAVKTGEINGLSSKKHRYYHIFNNEYNFSFLKPKRDQCVKCASSLLSQKLVLVF